MKALLRAHGETLGRGKIRAKPEDFQVTELYDFTPTGSGEHLLLWIEKKGANTGWVANQLAQYFDLRHFDVSYCGKKDRHAVTRQWFSCWLPKGLDKAIACDIEGATIVDTTWHNRKLRRGEHVGNHFELIVSDLEVSDPAELEARLGTIQARGVPNYFGRQRFGHDQSNYHKACELIADSEAQSRRKLDRKQKDIYVSALRSWLFNDVLVAEVAEGTWDDDEALWVYGLSPHRDIEVPHPGVAYEQATAFIEKIKVKAHTRAKRILPQDMAWQVLDKELKLSFSLPVGAFATTLLEELLEIEEGQ